MHHVTSAAFLLPGKTNELISHERGKKGKKGDLSPLSIVSLNTRELQPPVDSVEPFSWLQINKCITIKNNKKQFYILTILALQDIFHLITGKNSGTSIVVPQILSVWFHQLLIQSLCNHDMTYIWLRQIRTKVFDHSSHCLSDVVTMRHLKSTPFKVFIVCIQYIGRNDDKKLEVQLLMVCDQQHPLRATEENYTDRLTDKERRTYMVLNSYLAK